MKIKGSASGLTLREGAKRLPEKVKILVSGRRDRESKKGKS